VSSDLGLTSRGLEQSISKSRSTPSRFPPSRPSQLKLLIPLEQSIDKSRSTPSRFPPSRPSQLKLLIPLEQSIDKSRSLISSPTSERRAAIYPDRASQNRSLRSLRAVSTAPSFESVRERLKRTEQGGGAKLGEAGGGGKRGGGRGQRGLQSVQGERARGVRSRVWGVYGVFMVWGFRVHGLD